MSPFRVAAAQCKKSGSVFSTGFIGLLQGPYIPKIADINNVWCIKNRTKLSNVLLLSLVRILLNQTLAGTISFFTLHAWNVLPPIISVLDLKNIYFMKLIDLWTWFLNLIFCLFWTWFMQATQAVKIKFEIDKNRVQKSSLK